MFLRYVHNFRAVAIVFIVAGHAAFTLGRTAEPRTMDLLADVLDYGTVLFLFIAGFLFQHLAATFDYRRYLGRKLRNVILPYAVTLTPGIAFILWTTRNTEPHPLYRIATILVTGLGTPDYPMWFVPMIALFYLAAPLFILVVRHPRLYWITLPLLAFSLLAHRPPEIETAAIALYFLPVYLIGMWACHERDRLEPLLLRVWPWLLAVFVGAVITRFLFSPTHGGDYSRSFFSGEYRLIDEMLLMKLVLAFALIGVLQRFASAIGTRLTPIADISFTIFFVHVYLLYAFVLGSRYLLGDVPEGTLLTWFALTVAVVGVTAAATFAAKRVLGRHSRSLIGS
ncbi:acyltransferase family protein [Pseudonocardia sp. GCM10023141]|uniref:acyltransferase family protein n=1 Tax=Pseudonocardia sp. GCM10023141 TaxID=3252653 RepID=UPI00361F108A